MLIVAEGSKVQWTLADHLGTPRMVVDKSGRLFDDPATTTYDERLVRHDYLPFGEELFVGMGNSSIRSAGMGYVADAVRQKFGSKERDLETGLDYFGARYFASVQGRFTSPDDYLNDTYTAAPASWNLYAYVRNNPLTYIDPDGEEVYSTNLTEEQKKQLIKDWQNKTGYKKIYFDKANKLIIDTAAGFKGGSARARNELLTAATSTSKIFNLRAVSGTEAQQVAFADNRATMVSTDDASGNRTDTYETRIDFGDFKQLKGDKDAKKAFTVGIALLHEFEHGLREGDPGGADSPRFSGFPGWLEVLYINPIRAELGLAKRLEYSATLQRSGKYAGFAEVRFRNNKGTVKILRWQDSVVGGRHQ